MARMKLKLKVTGQGQDAVGRSDLDPRTSIEDSFLVVCGWSNDVFE